MQIYGFVFTQRTLSIGKFCGWNSFLKEFLLRRNESNWSDCDVRRITANKTRSFRIQTPTLKITRCSVCRQQSFTAKNINRISEGTREVVVSCLMKNELQVWKLIKFCLCVARKGGIFPENSEHLVNAFQNAVRVLNTSNELLKLQAVTVSVDINDSFKVQKAGILNHFCLTQSIKIDRRFEISTSFTIKWQFFLFRSVWADWKGYFCSIWTEFTENNRYFRITAMSTITFSPPPGAGRYSPGFFFIFLILGNLFFSFLFLKVLCRQYANASKSRTLHCFGSPWTLTISIAPIRSREIYSHIRNSSLKLFWRL